MRYGDVHFVTPPPIPVRVLPCSLGDGRPQKSHGLCDSHYRRWQRWGDPLYVERRRHNGTPEQRWWAKVDVNGPGGCWLWQGSHEGLGYGSFGHAGRTVHAYRWGYLRFVGPIAPGLELDHLCRRPQCVRFDHLEPVTHTENVRRGIAARAAIA